jgi:hypothetical protein
MLRSNQYMVCEKTDGVRHNCACFKFKEKNVCVLVNRVLEVYAVTINLPKKIYANGGSMFDGELVKDPVTGKMHFLIYDGMRVSGVDIRQMNLLERLDACEKILTPGMKMASDTLVVKLKTFYPLSEFEKMYRDIRCQFATDGFIFTPVKDPVRTGTHRSMFKWKPAESNTVDFQVKWLGGTKWGLYTQERGVLFYQAELGCGDYPDLKENSIVECMYMTKDYPMWWRPIRERADKNYPNSRFTYFRTVRNISEDIQPCEFFSM